MDNLTNLTWNKYFDENDVEDWSISHFHRYWNCDHGGEPRQNRFKSADALVKSLRAISCKSSEPIKIKKANKLLEELKVR